MDAQVNSISARDGLSGCICQEILFCAKKEKWFAAISTLFLFTEQILRWATDVPDEVIFKNVIAQAFKMQIISDDQQKFLHSLREMRNAYFHANFHSSAFVFQDKARPLNESDSLKIVFETFAPNCFQIIDDLLSK